MDDQDDALHHRGERDPIGLGEDGRGVDEQDAPSLLELADDMGETAE